MGRDKSAAIAPPVVLAIATAATLKIQIRFMIPIPISPNIHLSFQMGINWESRLAEFEFLLMLLIGNRFAVRRSAAKPFARTTDVACVAFSRRLNNPTTFWCVAVSLHPSKFKTAHAEREIDAHLALQG